MKKITYLLILLISVFSCTKESSITENILPDYDANLIASRYLVLTDNSYKLNLTEEQAENLLISQKQYRRMLQEIEIVNKKIKEGNKQGEDIYLVDPKERLINQKTNRCLRNTILTKGECGTPIAFMQTFNNAPTWQSGFLPSTTRVSVSVWCGGIVDLVTYGIKINNVDCFGSTTTIVGYPICKSDLFPPYSHGDAKFFFQTSNSNGGTCTFYIRD